MCVWTNDTSLASIAEKNISTIEEQTKLPDTQKQDSKSHDSEVMKNDKQNISNNKKSQKKGREQVKRTSESEFVSDTLQTNEEDLEEVKAGIKKLGIDSLAKQALETNKNGKAINIYFEY